MKDELNELLSENASLRKHNATLIEALIWCSGSQDFSPGGKAHEGWKKIVPLLDKSKRIEAASRYELLMQQQFDSVCNQRNVLIVELKKIASCQSHAAGDVVDIARAALEQVRELLETDYDRLDRLRTEQKQLDRTEPARVPRGEVLRDIIGAPGRLPDSEVERIADAIEREMSK